MPFTMLVTLKWVTSGPSAGLRSMTRSAADITSSTVDPFVTTGASTTGITSTCRSGVHERKSGWSSPPAPCSTNVVVVEPS